MKNSWKILLTVLLLAGVALAGCSSASGTLETVSPDAAAEVMAENPNAIILDIRTPEEFYAGTIEGSINIDYYAPDFAAQLDKLDKDADYVMYCNSGNRSGEAMDIFSDLEFQSVTEIDGGIQAWYSDGLPVVTP